MAHSLRARISSGSTTLRAPFWALRLARRRVTTSYGYTPTGLITTFSHEMKATLDSMPSGNILVRRADLKLRRGLFASYKLLRGLSPHQSSILDERVDGEARRPGRRVRYTVVQGGWTTGLSTDQRCPRRDLKRAGQSSNDIKNKR